MTHADDAEDDRLLQLGERAGLLARWYPVIVERCRGRLRSESQAMEAAHQVVDRLLVELDRGRAYSVPYRVVVHQVTTWTIRGFHDAGGDPWPEGWDPPDPDDPLAGAIVRLTLEQRFADLPEGERRVMTLLYLDGRTPVEVGEVLGMTRNAVDQAHHRAKTRLREILEDV